MNSDTLIKGPPKPDPDPESVYSLYGVESISQSMRKKTEKKWRRIAGELYVALEAIVGNEPQMMRTGYGKPAVRLPGIFDFMCIGDEVNAGVDLVRKYKKDFEE